MIYTAIASSADLFGKEAALSRGWGNGYVLVPPGHPCYGKTIDQLSFIRVHGRVTWAAKIILERVEDCGWKFLNGIPRDINDYWAIGFDTSHYLDNQEDHPKKFVLEQLELLVSEVEKAKVFIDNELCLETGALLYNSENVLIGHVRSSVAFSDIRVQIKTQKLEGYYMVWNNSVIDIDSNGRCSDWPDGFYDREEKLTSELL